MYNLYTRHTETNWGSALSVNHILKNKLVVMLFDRYPCIKVIDPTPCAGAVKHRHSLM